MPSRRSLPTRTARTAAAAALVVLATLAPWSPLSSHARADDPPSSSASASSPTRRPFPTRAETAAGSRLGARPDGSGSGSWWAGTAGIAVVLAVCGWLSIAARRYRPAGVAGAAGIRVVGRTSLSPKHTVYLLQAGDRVLIVGTGPQGPPALLGEMETSAAETEPEPAVETPAPGSRRIDVQLGDDA